MHPNLERENYTSEIDRTITDIGVIHIMYLNMQICTVIKKLGD